MNKIKKEKLDVLKFEPVSFEGLTDQLVNLD
jgi:hypothetical protein